MLAHPFVVGGQGRRRNVCPAGGPVGPVDRFIMTDRGALKAVDRSKTGPFGCTTTARPASGYRSRWKAGIRSPSG